MCYELSTATPSDVFSGIASTRASGYHDTLLDEMISNLVALW